MAAKPAVQPIKHFCGKRINRVHWQAPDRPYGGARDRLLAFGSWGSENSSVSVGAWQSSQSEYDDANLQQTPSSFSVRASVDHAGDVTALMFCGESSLLSASSLGALHLFQLDSSAGAASDMDADEAPVAWRLNQIDSIPALHRGPVTAVDFQPITGSVATVGEDGSIHFCSLTNPGSFSRDKPIVQRQRIANASSSSLYAAKYNGAHTLLTCGMSGRLSLWDARVSEDKPSQICHDPNSQALTSIAVHPARSDTVATGSSNGLLNLWDIRRMEKPRCALVHPGHVWDLFFVTSTPTVVVTCSEDGGLYHWDFNADKRDPVLVQFTSADRDNIRASKLYVNDAGMAFNSIAYDPLTQTIAAGSESESVLLFPGVA